VLSGRDDYRRIREMKRTIKMRKQPTKQFNEWDQSIEIGDRCIDNIHNKIYDIVESNGINKSRIGELTFKEPITQKKGKIPVQKFDVWYWQSEIIGGMGK
jgi:hypothetical protein